MLLSDGTVKSKINRILRYCAAVIEEPEDFYHTEDEILASLFQMYPQGFFDAKSLKPPVRPRTPTPIEKLPELEEVDAQAVAAHQAQLLQYARNAVTAENVNRFAHTVLKRRQAVTARELAERYPQTEDIVKIIGLHTYSSSAEYGQKNFPGGPLMEIDQLRHPQRAVDDNRISQRTEYCLQFLLVIGNQVVFFSKQTITKAYTQTSAAKIWMLLTRRSPTIRGS